MAFRSRVDGWTFTSTTPERTTILDVALSLSRAGVVHTAVYDKDVPVEAITARIGSSKSLTRAGNTVTRYAAVITDADIILKHEYSAWDAAAHVANEAIRRVLSR